MPRLTTYAITGPRLAQPVTIRQVNALLRQASDRQGIPLYEIVEENDAFTRTLSLHQHAAVFTPTTEEHDQPVQEAGEGLTPGDGHHELSRYREAAGLTFSEGAED